MYAIRFLSDMGGGSILAQLPGISKVSSYIGKNTMIVLMLHYPVIVLIKTLIKDNKGIRIVLGVFIPIIVKYIYDVMSKSFIKVGET